jgi:F0F1-type ATP synthase epsilon subunit
MSVYLKQVPSYLKFVNEDGSVTIETNTSKQKPVISINDGAVTLFIDDVKFVVDALESIENISKELNNK